MIKLEHAISPYVAFGIMPLFAFANAGVSLEGLTFASLLNKVPLGILLGLFVGKQLGVFVFSYISIKLKFAQMPIKQRARVPELPALIIVFFLGLYPFNPRPLISKIFFIHSDFVL